MKVTVAIDGYEYEGWSLHDFDTEEEAIAWIMKGETLGHPFRLFRQMVLDIGAEDDECSP